MPRRRRPAKPETFRRDLTVSSVAMHVYRAAVHQKGCEPEIEDSPWLDIRGTLDEAFGTTTDVEVSIYSEETSEVGPARPAAIGSIIQVKPRVVAVVPFDRLAFHTLWTMAAAGQVRFGSLYFTKPHYSKARVINVSFSNEREE